MSDLLSLTVTLERSFQVVIPCLDGVVCLAYLPTCWWACEYFPPLFNVSTAGVNRCRNACFHFFETDASLLLTEADVVTRDPWSKPWLLFLVSLADL